MITKISRAGRINVIGGLFPPHRGNQRGFTLLELIVVLVIISLMSALIVPRLTGPMGKLDLKTAARKISASLRYARSQAATEKTVYVAMFDFDRNSLIVINSPLTMGDFVTHTQASIVNVLAEQMKTEKIRSGRLKMYQPPDGVTLVKGVSNAGDFQAGLFPVFFFPGGSSSGGRITVANKQGRQYTITVDFITGTVQLSEVV